jgi:CPA1 family monovalent cation:H+ antiporter
MPQFEILAYIITLAAALGWLNLHVLKLPTTIGLMLLSLLVSLSLIAAGIVFPGSVHTAEELLKRIDFDDTLLQGLLGFLLFAGSLHVNFDDLKRQKWPIAALATIGVLISTGLVGGMTWLVLNSVVKVEAHFSYCLVFGALISPTDPIAVLAILKKLGATKSLETKFAGESLFNDGVAIVVFLTLTSLAGLEASGHTGEHETITAASVGRLFLVEVGGGLIVGLLAGLLAYFMLRTTDNYQIEVLISLALVAGGYALCHRLHISGPLAMVAAGLLIGNHGRSFAMSNSTREHLDSFWELIDEVLNALLFVLIGLELLVLELETPYLLAGVIAIPMTLLARFVAVGIPVRILRRVREFSPHVVKVLTWGGLRGGISIALALSLAGTLGVKSPQVYHSILVMAYLVVVFSIGVQGLTIGTVLRRWGLVES